LADHSRLIVSWNIASELQILGFRKRPDQFFTGAGFDQNTVRIVVCHPAIHFTFHMAHIMSTSRGKHAAAKHRNHFLLVRGMGGRVAEVEFMKQGSIVMQHKTDSLTCLDFNRLKRKDVIAHSYLNGAIYRLHVSWLS